MFPGRALLRKVFEHHWYFLSVQSEVFMWERNGSSELEAWEQIISRPLLKNKSTHQEYDCGAGGLLTKLCLTLETQAEACQAPLSMGFPRLEYWSKLPFPPPGDIPNPGIEPLSPALAGRFFTTEPPGKPQNINTQNLKLKDASV